MKSFQKKINPADMGDADASCLLDVVGRIKSASVSHADGFSWTVKCFGVFRLFRLLCSLCQRAVNLAAAVAADSSADSSRRCRILSG